MPAALGPIRVTALMLAAWLAAACGANAQDAERF
jgi:hypothetical protein